MNNNDIQYFNLSITNANSTDAGQLTPQNLNSIQARIRAETNVPILENPNEYYASVIRMFVPADYVPIAQFIIQTPVNDINLSVYSFTIQQGSNIGSQTFMQFVPDNKQPLVKPPPTGTQQQTFTDYYFIYNYISIQQMLNATLVNAVTAFNTQYGTTLSIPFFNYDSQTNLFSLYALKSEYESSNSGSAKIWYNSPMYKFLGSINSNYYNQADPQGLDYLILNYSNSGLNDVTLAGAPYIKNAQQYVDLSSMAFIKSFLVTTEMNVVSETFFINNKSVYQNVNFVNVLTDFLPDIYTNNDAGISSKGFIYNAPSLYKLFQFQQKDPLRNITAYIYFTDQYNNIYPLPIDNGLSANIKFMFIKKNLIKDILKNKI